MSTNKHAQIRYNALDNCFSNYGRKYYIKDLVQACNEAIYNFSGKDEGVRKRQIYDDIKFMESSQGWQIELDREKDGKNVYHRYVDRNYSIAKGPLNQVEVIQIKEVLLTLSRFKGMPHFEWIDEISTRLQTISIGNVSKIIDFEQNQFLKGLNFITPLFNAVYNKRVLNITYLPFKDNVERTHKLHPYYLKQYNLRWFLFGLTEHFNQITNLPLDRILDFNELDDKYIENLNIVFDEYFDDVIGVSILKDKPLEVIQLYISAELWPYIKTKPIHGSQKPPVFVEGGVLIELQLIVNYELIARFLSYGEALTVLSPKSLVIAMKNKAQKILSNYS